MRQFGRTLLPALLGSMALVSLASADTTEKVTICHFPPGNPANIQTITISTSALPAHLAHGDFGGPCANDCKLFGSICNDGDACTTDTCNPDGTCSHSAPTDCNDNNPCTSDSCETTSGACVNTPQTGASCDDGMDCTANDQCDAAGQCHGTAIVGCCDTDADCGPNDNLCNLVACVSHICTFSVVSCAQDPCAPAACNPSTGKCESAPKDCSDSDPCTTDTCDFGGICQHTKITCGAGAACVGGTCVPCPCADEYQIALDNCRAVTGTCVTTLITPVGIVDCTLSSLLPSGVAIPVGDFGEFASLTPFSCAEATGPPAAISGFLFVDFTDDPEIATNCSTLVSALCQ